MRHDRQDPFSDPLSAAEPRGAERARLRLRQAGILLYATGAATLAMVLLAPDPDTSDHLGLALCGLACALLAGLLAARHEPPAWVLHLVCPAGTLVTTAAVAVAEPVSLTPIFYLLPATLAAYFLRRWEIAANLALIAASYALALLLFVDPVLRMAQYAAVLACVGVITFVVVQLKEQVALLVARLQLLATRDSLTGALNRSAFEQRLEEELTRSVRTGRPCALVLLDVDHFKRINDRHGHAAGDEALRALARVVVGAKRRADVFARVGGEEFAVLLTDSDAGGALAFAEHLRQRLAAWGGPEARAMTVSAGVVDVAGAGPAAEGLLRAADEALYAAKARGRDRVEPWVPGAVAPRATAGGLRAQAGA